MDSLCMENVPILIDENMLKKVIIGQANEDVESIMKTEGINFDDVVELSLGNKDIVMITHMWDFTSLQKLYLGYNLIRKIEGLHHLFNLTWLNLSFNHIEKIEGLESLRKLELLDLSNNKISVIENMDTLERLTELCIGNNAIGQLQNVLYLKKFKNLDTLKLSGNPVSKEQQYKLFIAAYFPNLMYLDDIVLDKDIKKKACIKYKTDQEEMRPEADDKNDFARFLNECCPTGSMLKDDPEAGILCHVPEMDPVMKNAAMKEYKKEASEILQQKLQIRVELQQKSDPDLLKEKISHCKNETSQLSHILIEMEFLYVSQIEDMIKKLDRNLSDMVGNFSETAEGIFTQCRDVEDEYYDKVRKVAVATLERVAKDEGEMDMSDDVIMLFTDRDAVMDALDTGHANHLQKINDTETQLLAHVSAWKAALIKGIQDKELIGNRTRLADCHGYVVNLREELKKLQM